MRPARTLISDPVAIIRLLMLLMAIAVLSGTQADPDLWGHVRFGHDIVVAKSVPRMDSYSFTTDRPWINHEWLAEVTMYAAYRAAAGPGLILLKLAVDLGLLALVIIHLRRRIPTGIGRDLLVGLLVLGILPRAWPVRPQLYSLLLFAAILSLVTRADEGSRRPLLLVPPLMALWVNLHGGWLVGLGVLGLWLAFRLFARGAPLQHRLFLLGIGCLSVAATLVNPYGIGLWRFLYETVGLSRPDIQDWQPLYRLPILLVMWVPVVVAGGVLVVRAGRRNVAAYVAIVAILAAASWKVSRLDAFFAIAVVMLLGGSGRVVHARSAPARSCGSRVRHAPERLTATTAIAAGLLVVPVAIVAQTHAYDLNLRGTFMPEPHAARFVVANHLNGRMMTPFDWGEYAIWHFSPDVKVSLDGRRETVYSDGAMRAVYAFYEAGPGALDYAARLGVRYVWVPNKAAVLPVLQRAGWRRVFEGPISSIFVRPGDRRTYQQQVEPASTGSFPGP